MDSVQYKLTVNSPSSLLEPFPVPQRLLLGPGPSNCPEIVRNASSEQMLGHLDEDFLRIMDDVKKGIQYVFQTKNEMTFAVSGTGHCAMETAICNLLEPGDIFLIASPGIWGDRAHNIGKRLGIVCHQMSSIDPDAIVEAEILEKMIRKIKPKVVFICHGDSSTGVLQPLEGIAELSEKYDCLFIVDAVASLGAAPIFMDEFGIDVLYSGSQKILNAPPGLSPISFSSKAVEKIKKREQPVPSFYMDCLLLGNYWNCDDKAIKYHHTAPISLMYALRAALSILAKETLENSWRKHRICASTLYEGLEKMNLFLYVPVKGHRLPSVTTVMIPDHVNGNDVVQKLRKGYGIDIAGGLGSTAGKVWRIGLMGCNCSKENVTHVCRALSHCISSSFKSKI